MRFGPLPLDQALGAILAHSHAVPGGRLRKGKVLTVEDIAALRAAGEVEVVVARLDPEDLAEDAAAARIGAALLGDPEGQGLRATPAATGRVNLIATGPGILDLDPAGVAALNAIDPAITLATLPRYARVGPGTMAGTLKIIPYGVAGASVARACAVPVGLRVRGPVFRNVTLIETHLGPHDPQKGEAAIRARVEALGMALDEVLSVPHRCAEVAGAIRAAGGGLVLILTASATSDIADVAPQALREAGGTVTRFGMPVDPGNLLFLGEVGGRAVIGLPGSARSPVPNGADMVLDRIACGVAVSDADIAAMGVGGLLKETRARGRPRAG
ncbi:molybdopterin-binding protein [Frigidibacter sp. ROC022]|uniref:molybdopterin-binding protein n=1 Tax=Frigidibacter sp. ROC022 TaxID=2971796 RepID=UPI00215B4CBE|nr:molybdopterin-binding protein [Frigidibacter sp. ROC022]MCR8726282.1 molybdopterin-binding protein [Frigidibacter sp. ROC022]